MRQRMGTVKTGIKKRWQSLLTATATIGVVLGMGPIAPAVAATVFVDVTDPNPVVAGCGTAANPCNTIQDGVDAAVAGDTVSVRPGGYFERVTIPAGKDGLILQGVNEKRVTVIDPANPPVIGGGNSIDVFADDVTIERLTIKNGTAVGIDVDAGAERTTIRNVNILGPDDDCIEINGRDTLVEKVRLFGCGSQGVEATALNVTVRQSLIQQTDQECIRVVGTNALIENNRTQVCGSDCIDVDGANAELGGNVARSCDDEGIEVSGLDPVVYHSSVTGAGGDAYAIDCLACSGGAVTNNTALEGAVEGDDGFNIFADAAGLVVRGNKSERNSGNGFNIQGVGIVVRNNSAIENGADDDRDGFFIDGTDHEVRGNLSRGNHDDGYDINGNGHRLIRNSAIENLEDGFDFFGNGHTVSRNVSNGNLATAFELDPGAGGVTPITFIRNRSTDDRQAFCDDAGAGAVVDGGGNRFVLGLPGPACDLID